MSESNFEGVQAFHDMLGYKHRERGPHLLYADHMLHRLNFLREECMEMSEAYVDGRTADVFDALIDLVYVALGTADMMGLPWEEGWARVHAANMAKKPGVKEGRSGGPDAVKPADWRAPDLTDLVGIESREEEL